VCVAGTAVAVLALLVWLPSAWRTRQAASAD